SSIVSVATFAVSGLSCGPLHRTGTTSIRLHRATTVPPRLRASMVAVLRLTPAAIPENHWAIFALSGLTGRDSLTLEYLMRVGSCHTQPLLPPSSRCSMTNSQPSPSQLLNAPRLSSSIFTTKQTATASSSMGPSLSSAPPVGQRPAAVPIQQQFRLEP